MEINFNTSKAKYVTILSYVNISMIIIAPLLLQNANFYRYFRNIIITIGWSKF